MVERYLRLSEVAERLPGPISIQTIRRRIYEAGIKPLRPGWHIFISEDDFLTLMDYLRQRGLAREMRRVEEAEDRAARGRRVRSLAMKVRDDVIALNLARERRRLTRK